MSTMELTHTQEERLFCYQLLFHYYSGDLSKRSASDWSEITNLIKQQQGICQSEFITKAIEFLEQVDEQALEDFEYDYNRLFVGPGKLLASPYESSYRNFEGTIMQQETLMVRNFYHHGGLQLASEGQIPDDHLQFELEFILHLLNSNEEEQNSLYRLFLEKHLLQWSDKHCQKVIENSTNQITLAFAYLLKGLLQLEKNWIEGGE